MSASVYIVSAKRTPIGSFGGSLASVAATQLGAVAIEEVVKSSGLAPEYIQEVIMGNVVSANLGQAPARQAALYAGLPNGVISTTVNKVCASGLKATMYAAQAIALGQQQAIVAGGMESMSQAPYYVPKARFGYKYGDAALIDGLAKDGLTDVYRGGAMGCFADATAEKYGISREEQDAFAVLSYQRSAEAWSKGLFASEVVGVGIVGKKGETQMVTEDEEYRNVNFEKIPQLKPAFTKNGTVTAANASTLNDGAAALLLVGEEYLKAHNLRPLARIVSYADAAQAPEWFTTAPIAAANNALQRAGLSLSDIQYIELNEAFAVVPLAFAKHFAIGTQHMNVHGGGVSLGHPLGASGARILTTLLHTLIQKQARYGLAAICNGGGEASAMILERA